MLMRDFLVIKDFFDEEDLTNIQTKIDFFNEDFVSGKETAAGIAKATKNNLQLTYTEAPELIDSITKYISRSPILGNWATMAAMSPVIINKYEEGMDYGLHCDSPMIGETRSDISFTLFLSDPNEYEGGELVLHTQFGEQQIKPPAGTLVAYSTGFLHKVNPVTKGTRLAVIGWCETRLRDPRHRDIILDLNYVINKLLEANDGKPDENINILLKTSFNLQRMWYD